MVESEIKREIEARFGFFPPFFEPALKTPGVLKSLWFKTVHDYLENPLPHLFKEKLAALLGRYCSVPYCLICHSAALRPLGMSAGDVLALLEMPAITSGELAQRTDGFEGKRLAAWPASGSLLEESILHCCVAIFLGTNMESCHAKLRQLLGECDYAWLITFISYNQTAMAWAEAHPELAYEADRRAQDHLKPLLNEEPKLNDFFQNYLDRVSAQKDRRLHWLTEENRAYVEMEKRLRGALEESLGHVRVEKSNLEKSISSLHSEREIREKFVATLTHDLRAPLCSARLNAELACRKAGDPASVMKYSGKIIGNIDRADRMIRDLLDAHRLKAGEGLPVDLREGCLSETVLTATKEFQEQYGPRIRNKSSASAVACRFDSDAVVRVMENLTSNALKYGSPDGPITIGLKTSKNRAEITVHNEGNTIPLADQRYIFGAYHRSDAALASGQKGWGIGLILVKAIAEAHQGTILLESSPEAGTTFGISIPLSGSAA